MNIPHLFRCPISLDLFTDPVTLITGQTYDRSSIEKWLGDGNLTCPVTMQRLDDISMVPNHTLRHLIDRWLLTDSHFNLGSIEMIDTDCSLVRLKENLESEERTSATRLETLRKIRTLSEQLDSRGVCLIQLGFSPLLLKLLFGNHRMGTDLSPQESDIAEEALNCLLNLSPHSNMRSFNMIKEVSSLESLLVLLEHGNTKIQTSLCYLVEAVSSSFDAKEICFELGQTRAILQQLVSLLHQKSDPCTSAAAIRAISGLCSLQMNRGNVIQEGGIDGLISYLSGDDQRCASIGLVTLEHLLQLESGKLAAQSNPKTIYVLVRMVFGMPDHEGNESAVSSLLIMCEDSDKARREALHAGVLKQVLLLLQSQCSCSARTKARLLLKLLRPIMTEDRSNLQ